MAAALLSVAALSSVRSALLRPPTPLLRHRAPVCTVSEAAPEVDIVGDGGVLKRVLQAGSGDSPVKGTTVEVHYDGSLLATGARFDSSRERGKTFKFTLGEGKVIGGWEVGVASMKPGELSVLTCSPPYAYGDKGIPPIIPPASSLQFEVELLSVQAAPIAKTTIAEDNPDAPRTPQSIQAAYERKMAAMPAKKEGLEGLVEWFKGIYVFGLFSKNAEKPPWYLNPLITFPSIFVIVGLGFYLVVALGGLHRGEVPMAADDLSGFIDETPLPGAPGSRLTYEQLMPSTQRAMAKAEQLTYAAPPAAAAPAEVTAAIAPVAVPQVAAAPAAVASVFPPVALSPAAELQALEAQLAALKASAGQ